MAKAQYAPGSAVAVVNGGLAVLVELPIEHPLVFALFDCLRSDPTLDEVLELLVDHGLRDLGSFAAAALVPAGVRVVVRGGFAASVPGESNPVRASGVWTDRFVDRASEVTLSAAAVSGTPSLPLGSGVVLAGAVALLGRPAKPPAAPAGENTTILTRPAAPKPPVTPEPPPTPPTAATPPGAPAPVAAPSGAPAEATAELVGLALLADDQPIGFAPPRWGELLLPSGDRLPLAGTVILGRNPRVPTGHTGEPPGLVHLEDPGKDISSQHLQIGLDQGHVLVTDLGSTNGTQVVLPGRPPVQLLPYQPIEIQRGTRIVLARVLEMVFETMR